jgi:GNAT superfamily N-acetyltransferase
MKGQFDTGFATRRASPVDCHTVTSIITLAFGSDPLWSLALARSDGSTAHHAQFWEVFVEGALRYPWVWLTGSGEATSVWIPPGGTEMSDEQEQRVASLAKELLGPTASHFLELLDRFDAVHPRDEPHYYLSLLGTHPAHRGKGAGMAQLRHDLSLIDEEGFPAYLESSNPANNVRYAAVGFEALSEFTYPGGGPVVTPMWRPAR